MFKKSDLASYRLNFLSTRGKSHTRLLGVFSLLSLAGCAYYNPPSNNEPHAVLNINGEANVLTASGWFIYDNPCVTLNQNSGGIAVTGNISGRKKQSNIKVGFPVFLISNSHTTVGAVPNGVGTTVQMSSCSTRI